MIQLISNCSIFFLLCPIHVIKETDGPLRRYTKIHEDIWLVTTLSSPNSRSSAADHGLFPAALCGDTWNKS